MLLAYFLASCISPIAIVQLPVASINSDKYIRIYFDLYNFKHI